MKKIDRTFINNLIKEVKIIEYMESEYNSDFISNNKSIWFNTNCPSPNHNDDNPSFGVNDESNLFHCFGCGIKGDIIELVQIVEGYNFVESIQKLAQFANIDIEIANLDMKSIIKELNDNINDFFLEDQVNIYPGNLSENGFLMAFAERTKKYIRKKNFDINEINWIDSLYSDIEIFSKDKDYKKINELWTNFSKLCKMR